MIILNEETLKLIGLFERITHAKARDCFVDTLGSTVFVVDNGEIAKAVGKGGATIMRIRELLKRDVKIIEHADDIATFVANVVRPTPLVGVATDDAVCIMVCPDMKARGYLIGRNASALRNSESIVKRYFPQIQELKVELGETWERKHEA